LLYTCVHIISVVYKNVYLYYLPTDTSTQLHIKSLHDNINFLKIRRILKSSAYTPTASYNSAPYSISIKNLYSVPVNNIKFGTLSAIIFTPTHITSCKRTLDDDE